MALSRTSSASSVYPATARLWYSAADNEARSSAGRDGRASPARAFSARITGDKSNILATLKRTRACSSAGRTWRSAESANRFASSARPAANRQTARQATSGPRSGWRRGASSRPRAASSAAPPGSELLRTWAAFKMVSIATESPGWALSASWIATSVGNAPRDMRTSAACRSTARRTGAARLPRTASRIRSCRKVR